MMVDLRRMTPTDLAAVVAMEAASQPAPWSEALFRNELAGEGRSYLVACDGSMLLGFGGVMVVGEEAHVMNLLVSPGERGSGIGTKLMVAMVEEALRLGARHLTLEVRSRNEEARSLYSKFGLAPVGTRPAYYGDDDALILWVHDIDGEAYRERLEALA